MDGKKVQVILGRTVEADFNKHRISIFKSLDEEGLEDVIGSYSDFPQYCKKTMDEYYNNDVFKNLHSQVFGNRESHTIASVEDLYEGDYIDIIAEGTD